jgi:uncharacterized coiled-coil protein SlyX
MHQAGLREGPRQPEPEKIPDFTPPNHLCWCRLFQETDMVADSNSQIAWHRAQIRKHRETLKHLETGRFRFGQIAGAKSAGQSERTVTELKQKIAESERIVAAHERQARRPLTTDFQTLASAPWSNWNARGPSNT